MQAVAGYFDGNTCIPLDTKIFKPNQRVIITALDEFEQHPKKREASVSTILDELTGILHAESPMTLSEIRAERLEKKYGSLSRAIFYCRSIMPFDLQNG